MTSVADLHEQLGRLSADAAGNVYANGHTYRASDPSPLRSIEMVSRPDLACADRLAESAREHLAGLPTERREQLAREWQEGVEAGRRELARRRAYRAARPGITPAEMADLIAGDEAAERREARMAITEEQERPL